MGLQILGSRVQSSFAPFFVFFYALNIKIIYQTALKYFQINPTSFHIYLVFLFRVSFLVFLDMRKITVATCNLNQFALDFYGNLIRIKQSFKTAKELKVSQTNLDLLLIYLIAWLELLLENFDNLLILFVHSLAQFLKHFIPLWFILFFKIHDFTESFKLS